MVARHLLRVLAIVVALPALLLLAVLVGGVNAANPDWREPEAGVPVFLRTNGVHTWVMVPTVTQDMDWRTLAPARDIRDPRRAGEYLAIGFGNREFYLNTPTWADLRFRTAFDAMFGRGPGLVHVEHEPMPREDEYHRRVILRPAEYRRLAAFLAASFAVDDDGSPMPLLGRGYTDADVFYEGQGRYDGLRTCNQWTGEALRAAGVRIGLWTPLAQSIMWRF